MNLHTSEAYVSRAAHTSIEHDDEPALALDKRGGTLAIAASFFALFCVVGLALWGLPFYYDFMVRQFGWTRAQVTSGNALSKFVIGPLFGFFAGWIVDRFGPRRLMIAGILMAAGALVGLGQRFDAAVVLFLLYAQRSRLCLRRPSSVIRCCLPMVRGIPGKSDGACLFGNWIRGCRRPRGSHVSLHASRLARSALHVTRRIMIVFLPSRSPRA